MENVLSILVIASTLSFCFFHIASCRKTDKFIREGYTQVQDRESGDIYWVKIPAIEK